MAAPTAMAARVRPTAKRLLGGSIRVAAHAYDRARPSDAGAVVLAYHRVGGGTDSNVDLPAEDFDAQLRHLVAHHRVRPIDDTVAALEAGEARDGNEVVVTFDDGSIDFVDVALPLLVRHEVPATLYLATEFVGGDFPWGVPAVSWSALQEALSTGLVTIGSHTHTHRVMDKATPADAADEVRRSVGAIEDRLGVTPTHFAYPKGVPGPEPVVDVLADAFRSVAGAEVGVNGWIDADLRCLRRSPIVRADSAAWFARKACGGLRLEGVARRTLNSVRYRRAEV